MTQPASKRLVTEADITDPTSAAGLALSASFDPRLSSRPAGDGRTVRREFSDLNRTSSKWREVYGTGTFASTKDPLYFVGWNADRAVGGGDAGEGAIYWGMESHYVTTISGAATPTMEAYLDTRPNGATDGTYATYRPFATTVGKAGTDRWAQVQIDIGTDANAEKSQFNVLGRNASGSQQNLFHIDSNSGVVSYSPVTISTAYGNKALTLDASAAGNVPLQFGALGQVDWQMIRYNGDPNLYVWNPTNNRFHVRYTKGASNTAAQTELQSSLQVDGNVGFYGKTPVAQPARPTDLAGVIAVLAANGLTA